MKSFNQYLYEVGNQPYKWKRTGFSKIGTKTKWRAAFKTDNNKQKYIFHAEKYDKYDQQWYVVFQLAKASWHPEDDSWGMGVTGSQGTSAVRVFGTVAQIFEAFVKEVKPEDMEFIADKSEGSLRGSRSKIYSRFAKKFAAKHGYNLKEKDAGDETVFQFSSKKKGKKNK